MPHYYVKVEKEELWKVKADSKEEAEAFFEDRGYLTSQDIDLTTYDEKEMEENA